MASLILSACILLLGSGRPDAFALSTFYQKRFQAHDQNNDGVLDKNEYLAVLKVTQDSAGRRNALMKFSALDEDGDGYLTMEEFFNTQPKDTSISRQRIKGPSASTEKNPSQPNPDSSGQDQPRWAGDNNSTSPNPPVLKSTIPAGTDKQVYQGMVTNTFSFFDKNGDGIIVREEAAGVYGMSEGNNQNQLQTQQMVDSLFQGMDANQDGMISSGEYRQNFPKSFSF